MGLKRFVTTLDEVDEAFRSHYQQDEARGGYALQLDGPDESAERLKEFRQSNIDLSKKLKAAEERAERFKGVDPEKYEVALAAYEKLQADEEGRLIAEGKTDEVVKRRVASMREDFEHQTKALTSARDNLQSKLDAATRELSVYKIDHAALAAVEGIARINPGAKEDILNRARNLFRMNSDGKAEINPDAGGAAYAKDGSLHTMDSWAKSLVEGGNSHLIMPPESGETRGHRGGGDGSRGGRGVLSNPDMDTIGRNIDKIASGETRVVRSDNG